MAPSTLRIDAHVHVWDLARREQPWTEGLPVLHRSFGLTDLAPRLDAHAMDGAVVVHTVASLDETYELLDLAADETRVAGVVGWFDLESPALADDLAGGGGAGRRAATGRRTTPAAGRARPAMDGP